jgi:hypothetical protein
MLQGLPRAKATKVSVYSIDATDTATSNVSYCSSRTPTKDNVMNLRMLRVCKNWRHSRE